MPKKPKVKLNYDWNLCVWRDYTGAVVRHPRYGEQPRSLTSKTFINAYIKCVAGGYALNDFLKTNNKYSAEKVQEAARKMRKAYEAATEARGHKDSFPLLKRVTKKDDAALGKAVANALLMFDVKSEHQPGMKELIKGK